MTQPESVAVSYPQEVTRYPLYAHRAVTLVCGPPGSGKSTLARSLHGYVLELEGITASTWQERLKLFGRACYRIGHDPMAQAAVVRGAPTHAERSKHVDLCKPAAVIVLLTPADVCHQRITERNRPQAESEHAAVDAWWAAWNAEVGSVER